MRAPTFGFRAGDGPLVPGRTEHIHMEVELNVASGGSVDHLLGGRIDRFEADQLYAFWAGYPHRVLGGDERRGNRICWLTIPFSWIISWSLRESFVKSMLEGVPFASRPEQGDFEKMDEWRRLLQSTDRDDNLIVQHEVHARLRRLQKASEEHGASGRIEACGAMNGYVIEMLDFLSEHYQQPIACEHVARAAGVHPNYAMNLFRKTCGMTLQQHLTGLRLAHAQRRLVASEEPVGQIALESGFSSLSRFYVAFRRLNGCTPLQYRNRVSSLPPKED